MKTDRRFLTKAQNKTMKTIITSNSRPLLRPLCTILLGIAALWAMPGNARAQVLYVSQGSPGIVGEYDATTGAAINANFITGLNLPNGLAVAPVPSCSPSPRGKQNLGFQRRLRFFNKPICHPN
jgi:hypothetical protein